VKERCAALRSLPLEIGAPYVPPARCRSSRHSDTAELALAGVTPFAPISD